MEYIDDSWLPEISASDHGSLESVVRGVFFGGAYAMADNLVDDGFVPPGSGLNVVYGLNGAGETRFLARLQRLFDGEGGPGEGILLTR